MEKHAPGVAKVPEGTPTQDLQGRTFIGGKSREFAKGSSPQIDPIPVDEEPVEKQSKEDLDLCASCGAELPQGASFCPSCGAETEQQNFAKMLGLELTDDDIAEYLFKGYLVKDITLVKGKKATFKTLLPTEGYEIEDKLMEMFKEKDATQNQYSNAYALINLSYGWMKFDDQSLGESPEKRMDRISKSIGVHLIDLASKKWNQFNRAVAQMLEEPDIIKN